MTQNENFLAQKFQKKYNFINLHYCLSCLGVHVSRPVVGKVHDEILILELRLSPDGTIVATLIRGRAFFPVCGPRGRSKVPVISGH